MGTGGDRRETAIAALARIIASKQPGRNREKCGQHARREHYPAPSVCIHREAQRHSGGYAADTSACQGQAGDQREAGGLHPVRRKLQHRDKCDANTCTYQKPSDTYQGIPGCQRKQQRARGCHQSACRQYPARPPVIDQYPRRNLYRHVGVEIQRRQIAKRHGREGELGHQFLRDDRRRHSLEKSDQIEPGAKSPHGQRNGDRRIGSGLFHLRAGGQYCGGRGLYVRG